MKFIDCYPNFNLESLDVICSIWFHFLTLPPQLNHLEILKSLGLGLGDLIVVDSSYQFDNDVRMIFKRKFNSALQGLTKVDTRKVSYDCYLHPYKRPILEIIKIEKGKKTNMDILPNTLDFQKLFPKFKEQKRKSRAEMCKLDPANMEYKHDKEDTDSHKGSKASAKDNPKSQIRLKPVIIKNSKVDSPIDKDGSAYENQK